MRVPAVAFGLMAAFALAAPALQAQSDSAVAPPHISVVDGTATLEREDQREPAGQGTPLVPGDRVRTTQGRVEILFPDGSALNVDEYSTLELQGPTLLRLSDGRVLLFVAGASNPASALGFQIDTPAASAETHGPGEYRISILVGSSGTQTELSVVRGSGTLTSDQGTMALNAGERSAAWLDGPPSYPQAFNSARVDAFEQWAEARRSDRIGTKSAQYLPSDLRMYGGALDRYGDWQYEPPYGYVWYPTVQEGWRPYYDGYWAPVPTYGWTWIGLSVWSWPTHHYGRWGHSRNRWYWIPERRWAPAWVSWGTAPGYVSWCPLGFDNRPVFSLSVWNRDAFGSWTVLPRDRFGVHGRDVRRYAVGSRSLPAHTPFVMHTSAPVVAPRAVPRGDVGDYATSAGIGGPRRTVSASQAAFGRARSARPYAAPPAAPRASSGRTQTAPRGGQPTYRIRGERYQQPGAIRGQPVPPGAGGPPDAPALTPPRSGTAVPRSPERSSTPIDVPIYRGRPVPPQRPGASFSSAPPHYGIGTGRRAQPTAPLPPGTPSRSQEPSRSSVPGQPDVIIYRGRPVPPQSPAAPPAGVPPQYGVGGGRRAQPAAPLAAPAPPQPARQERFPSAMPRSFDRPTGAPPGGPQYGIGSNPRTQRAAPSAAPVSPPQPARQERSHAVAPRPRGPSASPRAFGGPSSRWSAPVSGAQPSTGQLHRQERGARR